MARRSEVFDLPASPQPGGAEDGRTGRGVARGPLPWVALAVILVLAGVGLSEPTPSPFRIGVVDRIGEPTQAWIAPHGMWVDSGSSVWLTDEAVLVSTSGAVAGFDRATGTRLWTLHATEPRCQESESSQTLCLVGSRDRVEVIVVDALTGPVSREPATGVLAIARHGEDSVVVRRDGEGAVLQRVAPDEEVLWSAVLHYRLPPGDSDVPDDQLWRPDLIEVNLDLTDQHAIITTRPTPGWSAAWVYELDGTHPEELANVGHAAPYADGLWMIFIESQWQFLHVDGSLSDLRPFSALRAFDDDPDSRIELNADPSYGVRAESGGHEVWTHPGTLSGRAAGTVLVSHDQHLVGLSERTGRELWREASGAVSSWPRATDGRMLATIAPTQNAFSVLDLHTGSVTTTPGSQTRGPRYARTISGASVVTLHGSDLVLWVLDP